VNLNAFGRRASTLLLALLLTAVAVAPAAAAPSEKGSGVGALLVVVPGEERQADGTTFQRFHLAGVLTGTVDGPMECDLVEKVGSDGEDDLHGSCRFTGSIAASAPGSVELSLAGECHGLTGNCEGTFRARPGSATAGLSTLQHLHISWEIPIHAPHNPIVYEAESHFKH
jgi:hypothetical protein